MLGLASDSLDIDSSPFGGFGCAQSYHVLSIGPYQGTEFKPVFVSSRSERLLKFVTMRPLLFWLATLSLFAQDHADLTRALGPSRRRIDKIDDQIVKLLNERAVIVREVGLVKKRFQAPVNAPARGEQVLRRVSDQARPPLSPDTVRRIYETIISEMTSMEKSEMERVSGNK